MKVQRTLLTLSVLALLLTLAPTVRDGSYEVPSADAANSSTQNSTVTFNAVQGLSLAVPATFAFGNVDFTTASTSTGNATVITNDTSGYTLTVTGPTNFTSGANNIPAARMAVAAAGTGGTSVTLSNAAQQIKNQSAAFTGAGDTFLLTLTLTLLSTDPVANGYTGTLTFTATGK